MMPNTHNNPPPNEGRESNLLLLNNSASLKGLRILVTDDDTDSLFLTSFILEEYGAKVVMAASVAEALKLFLQVKPDVLVCDIAMPEEDGYSLIRQVRELEIRQGEFIPAIALTAAAKEEDRCLSMEAGFQIHLTKPIEPVALVQIVAGLARQALFNKTESD